MSLGTGLQSTWTRFQIIVPLKRNVQGSSADLFFATWGLAGGREIACYVSTGDKLFVAEGFDRVEVGGFPGGVNAEQQAFDRGGAEAEGGPEY
jgi:hypothetical protein